MKSALLRPLIQCFNILQDAKADLLMIQTATALILNEVPISRLCATIVEHKQTILSLPTCLHASKESDPNEALKKRYQLQNYIMVFLQELLALIQSESSCYDVSLEEMIQCIEDMDASPC